MMHIEEGSKRSFWADILPPGISLMRSFDKTVLIVWLLALIASFAGVFYSVNYQDMETYMAVRYISIPFMVVGGLYMIYKKNPLPAIIIVAIVAVLYFAKVDSSYSYFIAGIVLGSIGVACVACALQRIIFYRTMQRVRYLNVKEKLSIGDRLVAFMFNVPPDLDTRNLEIDPPVLTKKFPWKDMGSTIMLSLVIGLFFWIYVSMNPAFMNAPDFSDVPLFFFTVILYIPVIVLPFSVFRSVNARIGTNYRDFKLYNGAVATIQRMAVPIAAAFLYVLLALNDNDPAQVLKFIALSLVTIFVVVALTSMVYYYTMEASIVSDIGSRWKIFMPVPLLVSLKEEDPEKTSEVPGTPVRDESDLGDLEIRVRA